MQGTREAVLLGAGASVEADVPATYDMTQQILDGLMAEDEGQGSSHVDACKFVIGALLFESSVNGNSPYDGIDVERVFRAVRLLEERDSLEISPFVGSWSLQLDQFETVTPNPFGGNDLVQSLNAALTDRHPSGDDLARAIRRVAGTARRKPYSDLAQKMIGVLREIVWIENPDRVGYLRPIATLAAAQEGLLVATLNYDNALELAARSEGISLSTGIKGWAASGSLDFSDGEISLLKLHGSIDWRTEEESNSGGTLARTTIEVVENPRDVELRHFQTYRPALVFGDSNKLEAEGPFLDLLQEFRHRLSQCHRLTVIGYSFRDRHIDHQIRMWMNSDPNNKISIIDPSPDLPRPYGTLASDLQVLQRQHPDRVEYIKSPASEAIEAQWTWIA